MLAGASYYDTRRDENRISAPVSWDYLSRIPQDSGTGFEVSAFKRVTNGTTEIVISFAGTYPKDVTGDIAADIALAGSGIDWVLAGAGDDWVDGGQGNDVIFGNTSADTLQGGTGQTSPVYYLCHIDLAWPTEYPAGIHQTRDHVGDPFPERDSIPGPHGLAGWLGLENRGMERMTGSRQTKVSRGGTPSNGAWGLAA